MRYSPSLLYTLERTKCTPPYSNHSAHKTQKQVAGQSALDVPPPHSNYSAYMTRKQVASQSTLNTSLCLLDLEAGRQSEHSPPYSNRSVYETRKQVTSQSTLNVPHPHSNHSAYKTRKQVAGQSTLNTHITLPTRPESRSPVRAH